MGLDASHRLCSPTGAAVAVTDVDKSKADAVVAEITEGGGRAVALELDVRQDRA